MRVYTFVSYVIDGETWFYDLGGLAVYYLLDTFFEWPDDGYTTECRLGIRFLTWCVIKLYCYVPLCRACNILIVANNIIHLGIQMISWICLAGDVTKTSDFYDHI